jgi:CrcB protein
MHPGVALQPSPPLTAARSPCTPSRHDSLFLWGAFTVNVTGSLVLGVLVGAANAVLGTVMDLLGAGLWGALTIYSMFGFERIRLVEDRARFYAVANVIASIGARPRRCIHRRQYGRGDLDLSGRHRG